MQINKEIADFLFHAIKKNGWIELPAQGSSMFPFIQQGDICRFIPCEASTLKKGDIILYHSFTGQLIAHRFCKAVWMLDERHYIFKGDTNLSSDEPVSQAQMIGKLVSVQKSKKTIRMTDSTARVWSRMIFAFPNLSRLIMMYVNKKRRRKSQSFSGASL